MLPESTTGLYLSLLRVLGGDTLAASISFSIVIGPFFLVGVYLAEDCCEFTRELTFELVVELLPTNIFTLL